MQCVNYRIPAGLGGGVTGRQKDEGVAVNRFAFQIAFQGRAVDLDGFHLDRLGAGLDWRDLRLYLRRRQQRQPECYCKYSLVHV